MIGCENQILTADIAAERPGYNSLLFAKSTLLIQTILFSSKCLISILTPVQNYVKHLIEKLIKKYGLEERD
jgi:hypothetical protein